MTVKLYDTDSHMSSFTARVISCEPSGDKYAVVLDRTAFFPEGGGQSADTGYLGDARVSDVQISCGVITHYTDRPLDAGSETAGCIDWDQRFRRMQNHSGEHIVSGTIHRLFGFDNVGFHMGSEDITLDINGELTRDDVRRVESLANHAVAANVPITAEYPEPERLRDMEYRSKLELTENVRIVTIEGYDMCACCAPHVSRTGEIGVIKLLDFARYKGGVRIHMLCGFDALEDYDRRCDSVSGISEMLSAKQSEVVQAVERIRSELSDAKLRIAEMKSAVIDAIAERLSATDGNICLFAPALDADGLRALVNRAVPLCGGMCAAFSGSDESGYMYIIGSGSIPLRAKAKEINTALRGKGGGRDEMIQGSVSATRAEIEEYFAG